MLSVIWVHMGGSNSPLGASIVDKLHGNIRRCILQIEFLTENSNKVRSKVAQQVNFNSYMYSVTVNT